eukprot:366595_1
MQSLLISIITFISAAMGDHMGHSHMDENLYDCGCATGLFSEKNNFSCDDKNVVTALQNYIVTNNCMMSCNASDMNKYDGNEQAFRCLQAFTLILQLHDYCGNLSINMTLIHEYLDHCPDCYQHHYYYEGADECPGYLKCQNEGLALKQTGQYVIRYCIDQCIGGCETQWKYFEGYHKMCYHNFWSAEPLFDKYYHQALEATKCDFHCNVPGDHNYVINCSSQANMKYDMWRIEHGDFDVNGILGMNPVTTQSESNAYYYSNLISFICVSVTLIYHLL